MAVLHPENEGFRRNGTRTRHVESCGQDSEDPQGTVNKTDKTLIQDLRQRRACPPRTFTSVACFARAWNYYGHLFVFHSFGLRDCFSHDRARISGREGVVTLFVRFTKGVDSSEKERKKYGGRWRQGEEEEEEAPNNSLRGLLKENCRHGKTEKKTASQAETRILSFGNRFSAQEINNAEALLIIILLPPLTEEAMLYVRKSRPLGWEETLGTSFGDGGDTSSALNANDASEKMPNFPPSPTIRRKTPHLLLWCVCSYALLRTCSRKCVNPLFSRGAPRRRRRRRRRRPWQ